MANFTAKLYLLYLALLPAVGTYVIFGVLKLPVNTILLSTAGLIGIIIFLAMVLVKAPVGNNPLKNLLLLIDGPAFFLIGALTGKITLTMAIAEDVLMEMLSMFLAIFILVLVSKAPTKDQRIMSFFFILGPLLGMALLFFAYLQNYLIAPWIQLPLLSAAMIQGTFAQIKVAAKDPVQADPGAFVILGLIAWFISLALALN